MSLKGAEVFQALWAHPKVGQTAREKALLGGSLALRGCIAQIRLLRLMTPVLHAQIHYSPLVQLRLPHAITCHVSCAQHESFQITVSCGIIHSVATEHMVVSRADEVRD